MEIGLGIMRISPSEFWNLSFVEFYSAVKGFKEFNCTQQSNPLTRSELEELMDMYPD